MSEEDFDKIEILVSKAQQNSHTAILELINVLNPFMTNLSIHTFIPNYTYEDVYEECIHELLKVVNIYKLNERSFVQFATTCIRNHIYQLLRKNFKDKRINVNIEKIAFDLRYDVDFHENLDIEDRQNLFKKVEAALNKLQPEYKDIIIHYYLQSKHLKDFKTDKNPYALKRNALKALKKELVKS